MFAKIQRYSYDELSLAELSKGLPLDLEPDGYVDLSMGQYFKMQKSLRKADEYLHFMKAKIAMPAGARWITVHPNGDESEGTPIMIQESGDGTAHVIAGAGGRINGLKLNKIKSKDEYQRAHEDKRERDKLKAQSVKLEEQQRIASMSKEERAAHMADKRQAKTDAAQQGAERNKKKAEAEQEFVNYMNETMGWQSEEIEDGVSDDIKSIKEQIAAAINDDDEELAKTLQKKLNETQNGLKRAKESQRKHFLLAGKEEARRIEREVIGDADLRVLVEDKIGDYETSGMFKTENSDSGLGFQTNYRESAEKKGNLDETTLADEKKKIFDERMKEIGEDNPALANMIVKGIETNKAISEVANSIYEEEGIPRKAISDIDKKAEILKKYLAMKKKIAALEHEEASDDNLNDQDSSPEPQYGKGTKLNYQILLDADLKDEATRIQTERQAAIHSSLLDTIKENPGGAGKWIANGNYLGFNSILLAALKDEGIDRDIVDILGIGASAELLAMKARRSMSPEAFSDFAEGMQRYHQEVNESIAKDAVDRGKEFIARAESIQEDIDSDPGNLEAIRELNDLRLDYLDEANRIVGQALGTLEASAAMVVELKKKKDPESLEVNLGAISSEDAIIRIRALGLNGDNYVIKTVNRNKIVTINAPEHLIDIASPIDLAVEQQIAEIKSGIHDEKDWLPDGLVRRSAESFKDPGPNLKEPAESVDNQSLGDDGAQLEKAEEAAHRTLGEMPEGAMAYKAIDDLTPQDQTELRRYWERNLYKGSMAEGTAGKNGDQPKGGVSRSATWTRFMAENGKDEVRAFEEIRGDLLTERFSPPDMFGEPDPCPLAQAVLGNMASYKRMDGFGELKQSVEDKQNALSKENYDLESANDELSSIEGQEEDLNGTKKAKREKRIEENKAKITANSQEIAKIQAAFPGQADSLYRNNMKEHYLKFMSGVKEFKDSTERQVQSPWGEYVRMHGDVTRAQEAVLDCIRGRFNEAFAKNYSQVTGTKLKTKIQKIRNHRAHVLGMLNQDMRDSFKNKFTAQLSSAGATVANRAGGKFAAGSWKDKAYEELERRKKDDAMGIDMFYDEDMKQNDGTEILSIGARAEGQLASMMPELSGNIRRGQRFSVSRGMDTAGERQRAIKMFEAVKRMNLTFGTGKGKTILSIGAFTNLKAKGLAKRAIFAVPSVVQSQFGGEVSVFCQPGKYKVKAEPNLDREGRIAAMKDGNLDMVVMTHQSIRDDIINLMAKNNDMDESAMKEHFNAKPAADRKRMVGDALKAEGIDFDMLTVDESHYTTNRQGKKDSTLANVMDALDQNVTYFMNQSATPVKNDISEAFDMLHKVAPDRFSDQAEFMKRYGVDSEYSKRSLQRIINRYNYSSQTVTGVKRNENKDTVQLTPEQQAEYSKVEAAFSQASKAQAAGTVDVEAMKYLSPGSFKNRPESEHEAIAQRLQRSAGVIKEEGLNRVVNRFDWRKNAKVHKVLDLIESKTYAADNPKTNSHAGDRKPGVIFAHNIKSIDNLREAMESRGIRVGVIQGSMNGSEKDKVKMGFNPPNPADRIYDVLLCSDAGATGLNLQNAGYLMNFDLPQTSWLKQQREGRIDRMGQAHDEIDYHDIVSDTEHEKTKWDRIQRKKELGSIFEEDPGALDDTGLAAMIANVRQDRYNQGIEKETAA